MITPFDGFYLWTYVLIDEVGQKIAPDFTPPGIDGWVAVNLSVSVSEPQV
jgi:hypothetical protein